MQPKSLERRLIDLERQADPAHGTVVTVFAVHWFGDTTKPYFIEYGDHTWTQQLAGSLEDCQGQGKAAGAVATGTDRQDFLVRQTPEGAAGAIAGEVAGATARTELENHRGGRLNITKRRDWRAGAVQVRR